MRIVMEAIKMLNHELSRMEAFRLLSECYFLPNSDLCDILNNLKLHLANVSESGTKCVRRMHKEIKNGQDFEALKIDFAKLFIGPYVLLAAPYGSVYLDNGRIIMGDSTYEVKNIYRNEGLDAARNFKDAPDHITAELEFMYYLIFKEIEAFSNSDIEDAICFFQKQ